MRNIQIGARAIGDGHPCYIIAEMSGNHAGSKSHALEIVHAAKEAGADCIKIQTYTPDTMTIDCDGEYFRIGKGTWQGERLYSLYQKAYTPWEWQADIKAEAEKLGLDFLSTAFDASSVRFLEELEVSFYKIASFELTDLPLLEAVAACQKPVILSTGMGSFEEIREAVETVMTAGSGELCLLKCSSAYPAVPTDMNLACIPHLKQVFGVPAGLSDHSMGAVGAVVAVTLGANVIEKHFCISREVKNPDSSFSMEQAEFKQMVSDIRSAERAIGSVHYGVTEQELDNLAFRRSIFAVKDIQAGEAFSNENLRIIRPSYGLAPKHLKEILGSRARTEIKRGTPIQWEQVEK